jgi:NitT/TauT family transport system substrate-binding protein
MRLKITPLLALLVAALLVAACGSDDSDDPSGEAAAAGPTHVKVGVIPIAPVAPLYLGVEKGFFEKEGLEVEPVVAQGGAAILPSVVSGELDFGFSNTVSLMIAREKGLDVKVVTQASQGSTSKDGDFAAVIAAGDSPIRSLEDLEGTTIGVNALQNIGDLAIKYALDEAGIDTSKVKFTEIPFPDMNAALDAGRVDATWQEEPFLSQAVADGARPLLYHYPSVAPALTVATYFTSEKTIDGDAEVAKAFVRAMNRSLEHAASHEDEVRRTITGYTEIDRRTANTMALPTWSSDLNESSIEKVGEIAAEQGLFGSPPPLDDLLYRP